MLSQRFFHLTISPSLAFSFVEAYHYHAIRKRFIKYRQNVGEYERKKIKRRYDAVKGKKLPVERHTRVHSSFKNELSERALTGQPLDGSNAKKELRSIYLYHGTTITAKEACEQYGLNANQFYYLRYKNLPLYSSNSNTN